MRYKPSLEQRDHGWRDPKPGPAGNSYIIQVTPPDELTIALAQLACWRYARGRDVDALLDDLDFLQSALGLAGTP